MKITEKQLKTKVLQVNANCKNSGIGLAYGTHLHGHFVKIIKRSDGQQLFATSGNTASEASAFIDGFQFALFYQANNDAADKLDKIREVLAS